jgi:hypothetical protein
VAPYFHVWGVPLSQGTDSKITSITEDADSIATYGEKTVTIDNDYIQSEANADALSEFMVGYYAQPHKKLENVVIMGDPRLEVGDRVNLTDASTSTGLGDDWWVTGIDYNKGAAFTQALEVMEADFGHWFILDDPVLGVLDADNMLAP